MIEAIKKRRAIRSFTSKKIEQEKIDEIIKSAVYSPSARNSRKWSLIQVTNKPKIQQLAQMKKTAKHIAEAQLVFIVCSEEWKYWIEDASIVAEHIWLETFNQNLASGWVQVRDSYTYTDQDSEEYVREILNIPADIRILCMLPIGYANETKSSYQLSDLKEGKIHFNNW